jgi:hypothetical protein
LRFFHISSLENASREEAIYLHTLYSHLLTQARLLAAILPWSVQRPATTVPTVYLTILVLLLMVAISKRTRQSLSILLAAVAFLFAAGAMLKTQEGLRPSLRWGLWSRRLKAQVLAQPSAPNEELKHIEWDGWGGAPVGDWTAYIVYDPTDSLAVEAKAERSGSYKRIKGIPCEVDSVRRLEAHWYSVVLGMNEWWDRCGAS